MYGSTHWDRQSASFTLRRLACRIGCAALLMWLLGTTYAVEASAQEVGALRQSLVDGELDEADRSVVAILLGDTVVCSGVLIADDVVLTAAHCLSPSPTAVFFGTGPQLGGETVAVAEARPHPRYLEATLDNDIGALLLAGPPPLDAQPARLVPNDRAQLDPGQMLRLVGFGDGSASGLLALKQTGHARVTTSDETAFYHEAAPAQTCHGDSGGPAFVEIDGLEYVVGIASAGDDSCDSFGRHMAVAHYQSDFIAHFPEPSAGPGERCHLDSNCTEGLCVDAITYGSPRYCARPCAAPSDCRDGAACVLDLSGQRLCRPLAPEPGALGSPCALDSDCAASLCAEDPRRGQRFCSLRCFPENSLVCPEPFYCQNAGDGSPACFPAPDLLVAAPPLELDWRCTAAPPGRGPDNEWRGATVLALLVTGLLVRRRGLMRPS